MGEVKEQRYVCKICSKSCVSGKSLGGHMRVHLALISATKKAAKATFDRKMHGDDQDCSYQLEESSTNQSNSTLLSQEQIKNGNTNPDFDYELRENPKKSWRYSDPKHGISDEGVSCKECGKEFSTLRALSGHMMCHQMKNKEVHQCKECGKGFDSMRAMFGHMKTHSKRSRVSNGSAGGGSGLENLCPVRKKRSSIRYKITPNPSFSSLNESTSADSERKEVNLAAKCLMMISRGETHWVGINSVAESDDEDSLYFGAESSAEKKRMSGKDDLICDDDKMLKMDLSSGVLEYGISGSATNGNVFGCDDLDSRFAAENKKKVDLEVSDNWLLRVENEEKKSFEVSDHGLSRMDEPKEPELSSSQNTAGNIGNLKDCRRKCEGEYRACNKISHSNCDLKGHDTGRKIQGTSCSSSVDIHTRFLSVTEGGSKLDQFEGLNEQESAGAGRKLCESQTEEEMSMNEEIKGVDDLFDLNFPVTFEGTKGSVGSNQWWIESGHEHELLVLTT